MPLYDYDCRDCDKTFEALVSMSARDDVQCPSCASTQTERSPLARFAVGSSRAKASPALPAGCGSCSDPRGPGACGLN